MIINDTTIETLRASGVRVNGRHGQKLRELTREPNAADVLKKLGELLEIVRSQPTPRTEVQEQKPERPRKWRFEIHRDAEGRMQEITAEAED